MNQSFCYSQRPLRSCVFDTVFPVFSIDCFPSTILSHSNSNWHEQSGSLHVYNASSDSQGIFRCNAENKAGKTHLLYKVTVVSPAKVTEMVVYDGSRGSTVLDDIEVLVSVLVITIR